MAWRDNLRAGSYKGVAFFVESHEASYDRRTVVNEYPFRATPYTEDMGRSAKKWDVAAYVLGADYMTQRDALLNAVEAGGAGILIHPYLGTLNVVCSGCRFRESQSEGGIVSFQLSFVEAGESLYPSGLEIPSALALSDASALISTIQTDFINTIQVEGVAEWVRESYSDGLAQFAGVLNDIKAVGGINGQGTTALINQAAEWVADVTELVDPALSLIADVTDTAGKIISTFEGLIDLAPSSAESANNLESFADFSAAVSPSNTAQAAIANNNAASLEGFIRILAVANESKAAVAVEYDSYEAAISARADILARIDAQANVTGNDDVYEGLRALRASVAQAIPDEENSLPRISALKLKQSAPSLVVSYDLYGTVDNETDILNRNSVRHPGFMPGGEELSVLEYE